MTRLEIFRAPTTLAMLLVLSAGAAACGGGQSTGTTTPEAASEPTAMDRLRAQADAAPGDAALQRRLLEAELFEAEGDPARWEAQAERATAAAPEDVAVQLMHAYVLGQHGHPGPALEATLATIELAAAHPNTEATAAASDAVAVLDGLVSVAPNFPSTVTPRLTALADNAALDAQIRFEIRALLQGLAFRRGDVEAVDAQSRARGCVSPITAAGPFGPRVMLGFGEPVAAAGPGPMAGPYPLGGDRGTRPTRALESTGCGVNLGDTAPLTAPGTTVAEAFVDVPEADAGPHLLRVLTHSSVIVTVDGDEVLRRDARRRVYGAVSVLPLILSAGRHEIEVTVTTRHSNPFLSLALFPGEPRAPLDLGNGASRFTRWLNARALLSAGDPVGAREATRGVERTDAGLAWMDMRAAVAGADPFVPSDIRRDEVRSILRQIAERDPRAWEAAHLLVRLTQGEGREQEALATARQLVDRWPDVAPLKLLLVDLLVERGWDADADRLIAAAREVAPETCEPIGAELAGAERRDRTADIDRLTEELMACNARSDARFNRRLAQRRWDEASAELDRLATMEPPQTAANVIELRLELARARGDDAAVNRLLAELRALRPRAAGVVLEQADRTLATGSRSASLGLIESALSEDRVAMARLFYPRMAVFARSEMTDFRLDGAQVIRDYEASNREYAEPEVLVLDYMAVRVFEDRSRLSLVHNIWQLKSDEAIDAHGQFGMPEGAYLLSLRTIKADGSHLEPTLIRGMDTISMPNLEVGDYIEYEYMMFEPPPGGYPGGVMSAGFRFQTFETPYDRSELVVAVPPSIGELTVVPRGDAPETQRSQQDGLDVYRWRVDESRPREREPGSVSAVEFNPSIRWGAGATWEQLFETLLDELSDKDRVDPAARRIARRTTRGAESEEQRARMLFDWVLTHIEPAQGGVFGQAGVMLRSRRGDRTRVLRYLLQEAGISAELVLARDFTQDPTVSPLPDPSTFGDLLLRVGDGEGATYLSTYARGVPYGYVPVTLRGQPAVVLTDGAPRVTIPTGQPGVDRHTVDIGVTLRRDGSAQLAIRETLQGSGAVQWRADLEGIAEAELESRFEEAYVARIAPGAQVQSLEITGRTEREQPLVLAYTFDVPRIGRLQGGRWVIPPLFVTSLGQRFAQAPSRTTTQLVAPVDSHVRIRLTPPRGAPMAVGPRDGEQRYANGARVSVRSQASGETTIIDREIYMPLSRVPASDYAAFAQFCRTADELLSQETYVTRPR